MRTPLEIEATAREGAFSQYDIAVLLPYIRALKPGQVYLEVGVDKGRSLQIAREESDPGVTVIGVDLRPDPEVEGAVFYQADSTIAQLDKKVDLIFIDGDHSYGGCKADIQNWYPQMADNGVMLFHDCDHTSPGVAQAFDEFVAEIEPKKAWKHPDSNCGMAVIEL